MRVIEQELVNLKTQTKQILMEKKELREWFANVKEERRMMYENLKTNLIDLNGSLANHFVRKINEIDKYFETIA